MASDSSTYSTGRCNATGGMPNSAHSTTSCPFQVLWQLAVAIGFAVKRSYMVQVDLQRHTDDDDSVLNVNARRDGQKKIQQLKRRTDKGGRESAWEHSNNNINKSQ